MVGGSVANVDEGVQLLVVGAFGLPMSLTLIRICGAELLTANSCFLAIAVFEVSIDIQVQKCDDAGAARHVDACIRLVYMQVQY